MRKMKSRINFIFPAAGNGQRFKDVGELTPKPLLLVEGIPLLVWAIANFNFQSNDYIYVIVQKRDLIKEFFYNNFFELYKRLIFIEINEVTKGPAETVLFALKHINSDEPVIIANTDQFVFKNLNKFVNKTRKKVSDGRILTMSASGNQWSYLSKNHFNRVLRVEEKKQISNEATIGLYSFAESELIKNAIVRMIENRDLVNGEYYIAPSYNYLIQDGRSVIASKIIKNQSEFACTGTPRDLAAFKDDYRVLTYSKKIKDFIKNPN